MFKCIKDITLPASYHYFWSLEFKHQWNDLKLHHTHYSFLDYNTPIKCDHAILFQADVVYAPFLQRYLPLFIDLHKYDITEGRPKLAAWLKV